MRMSASRRRKKSFPFRPIVAIRMLCQPPLARAIGVHHIDFRVAIAVAGEGDELEMSGVEVADFNTARVA